MIAACRRGGQIWVRDDSAAKILDFDCGGHMNAATRLQTLIYRPDFNRPAQFD